MKVACGNRERGDRHWSRRHPERRPWGDRNGSRKYPERLARGSDNPNAKLVEREVVLIRELRRAGWSTRDLAARYGVSRSLVVQIVARVIWRHV